MIIDVMQKDYPLYFIQSPGCLFNSHESKYFIRMNNSEDWEIIYLDGKTKKRSPIYSAMEVWTEIEIADLEELTRQSETIPQATEADIRGVQAQLAATANIPGLIFRT